jgi:hypothetical protein
LPHSIPAQAVLCCFVLDAPHYFLFLGDKHLFMLMQVRHIMFTWSLTNAIIDSLSDLEQAVTAAVCANPSAQHGSCCAGLLHRLFGWVLPCLPMLSGRNLVVYWYQMLCCELPQCMKQGWTGELGASCRLVACFKCIRCLHE